MAILLTGASAASEPRSEARRSLEELASRSPADSFRILPSGKDLDAILSTASADPRVGAIMVYPAPAGTAQAFAKLRASRPDLVLMAGKAEDDPLLIEAAADLVVMPDSAALAWNMVAAARKEGLGSIHCLSSDEAFNSALALAAKRAGLSWSLEVPAGASAKDGAADAAALASSLEARVEAAGPSAAWVAGSEAEVAQLVAACVKSGAAYLGSANQSSPQVLAEAFGLGPASSDSEALKALDKAAKVRGRTRIHAWPRSEEAYLAAALAELSARAANAKAVEGKGATTANQAQKPSSFDLLALDSISLAFRSAQPDINFLLSYRVDPATGIKSRNAVQVCLEDRILGTGQASRQGPKPEEPPLDFRTGLGSTKKN